MVVSAAHCISLGCLLNDSDHVWVVEFSLPSAGDSVGKRRTVFQEFERQLLCTAYAIVHRLL